MIAVNLRTEYLRNPLGIDIKNPRLMWNADGGIRQSAYQIVTERWDSGKVLSSSMNSVYPLEACDRERVNWKIRLWDENDVPGEWSHGYFEYGISKWKAKWIRGDYTVIPQKRYPVDCFKKSFALEKNIKRARLYISSCGIYEARINGEKAGNFCLAPGVTDYNKRVQYQTYDVKELMKPGENDITVELADGWYRGSTGAWGARNQYGTVTKVIAQLEIVFEDDTSCCITTDGSWKWSNDGPIRFADNKDGEIIEAYRVPSYSFKARECSHKVFPVASNNVYVTEHEHFRPVITVSPNGRKLLDFGQNIAGYICFSKEARKGQKMTWQFGEMLDNDGNLTLKNIQCVNRWKKTPLQKIEYECKDGKNDYKTKFSVFGFRYAEVDTDVELGQEDVEAIAVYSDMKETGEFSCSNELLNRFVKCTKWSTKSNSLDIPTDCPTRERHGWTGDAQIFFGTAAYLFDYASFAKKYLGDVYDWQKKNGKLPQIAPYGGVNLYMSTLNGSVGWSDAGIIIPYRFWKIYGDRNILVEYYDRMKKYAEFMIGRCGKNDILSKKIKLPDNLKKYCVNSGQSYGEWAEPADVHANDWKDIAVPHAEVSTAYTAWVMRLMTEISCELGYKKDMELFGEYADGCRRAYIAMCSDAEFTLDTDRQARLVRALYFDLLDEKQTEFARGRLIKALDKYGWRLGTGFLSTPLILSVLEKIDLEYAYRLLENEEMPGWLFMPKNGATTIWESWEGTESQSGIASLNHYSKGAVCEWLFESMCGIKVDGENSFVISPKPGGHFAFAEASYESIYGKVTSGWERHEGKIIYSFVIPSNCSARICLQGREEFILEAGKHVIE